jgi:hypothetical protein
MLCPVCLKVISAKRKKQIKHLYTHSTESVAYALIDVYGDLETCRRGASERREQPGEQPGAVFSLVEEDSEEDSDPDMQAAGMVQCEHCGMWVWPGDMPYHLAVACVEVGEQAAPPVAQPADTGDYAEVQYIRIAVDGPEFQLLNALALYCRRSIGK